MSPPIRVAISGIGVAGATLVHALMKSPHLDVHIFESAVTYKEGGAAIGIARNALTALDLIGPSASKCLEDAGAVPMRGVTFMLAGGPDKGAKIDETDDNDGKRVVNIVRRPAFVSELLADMPENRIHTSKKLNGSERQADGSLKLRFTDETTHECDILVGADGIHSTVRRLILGKDDPSSSPRPTGWYLVMVLRPFADAQASIGSGTIDMGNAREYMWVGNNTFMMHNILSQGEEVQLVIVSRDKEVSSNLWHRELSAEEIKTLYQDWPSHLNKGVNELLCKEPKQHAIYLWEHPDAPTYVSGGICVIGDAAHATTPWQGSGGGMTVEDSLILSTLLNLAKTPEEARAALNIYDRVRRPRTQAIVKSSRETGKIVTGQNEEMKLDLAILRKKLLRRWDFIVDFDVEKHRDEAVNMMERELKKGDVSL